jgi:hypothetical protein
LETMAEKVKYAQLKQMFWDYDDPVTGEDIYYFMLGEKDIPYLDKNQVIARMLTSFRWYEMIDMFGLKVLKRFMNDEILSNIWQENIRSRYEYVRKVLERVL